MDKFLIGLAAILGLFLVLGLALSSFNGDEINTDNKSSIQWGTDYNKAVQEAKNTNKNIFIDFYAGWCAYCIEMDEVTYASPQVKEKLTQNYVLLKVDVDKNPEISQKYQAYSLPTIVILDSNGNEINRIIGYQSPEQLLAQI